MGLQDTAGIGFTRKMNVITGLMHVYTIVTRMHSSFSPYANTLILRGSMSVDGNNHLISNVSGCTCDGEVINLSTNQYSISVNGSMIEVTFLSSGLHVEVLSLKDTSNHLFPESTSLWMTL